MKILFIIPSLYGGGAERVVVNLCNSLSNSNEIYLHTAFSNKQNKYIELLSNRVFKEGCDKLSIKSIIKIIKKTKPDVVLSTLPIADIRLAIATLCLPRSIRRKTVFIKRDATILRSHALHKGFKNNIIHYLSKCSYKYFDFYIANSNDTKKSICENTKTLHHKIQVIGNPVIDDNIINEHINENSSLSFPYILAVGRLVVQKRFDLLIESYSRINDRVDEHLVILGEGPLEEELSEKIIELGLEKKVHLMGFKNHLGPYYKNAKCYVMCSSIEGFGNVVVEALYYGTPIVSTFCKGGPMDILSDGKYGVITSPDVVSLSRGIEDILNGKIIFQRELLKQRALDYSVNNISREYLSYFETCIANKMNA